MARDHNLWHLAERCLSGTEFHCDANYPGVACCDYRLDNAAARRAGYLVNSRGKASPTWIGWLGRRCHRRHRYHERTDQRRCRYDRLVAMWHRGRSPIGGNFAGAGCDLGWEFSHGGRVANAGGLCGTDHRDGGL